MAENLQRATCSEQKPPPSVPCQNLFFHSGRGSMGMVECLGKPLLLIKDEAGVAYRYILLIQKLSHYSSSVRSDVRKTFGKLLESLH